MEESMEKSEIVVFFVTDARQWHTERLRRIGANIGVYCIENHVRRPVICTAANGKHSVWTYFWVIWGLKGGFRGLSRFLPYFRREANSENKDGREETKLLFDHIWEGHFAGETRRQGDPSHAHSGWVTSVLVVGHHEALNRVLIRLIREYMAPVKAGLVPILAEAGLDGRHRQKKPPFTLGKAELVIMRFELDPSNNYSTTLISIEHGIELSATDTPPTIE